MSRINIEVKTLHAGQPRPYADSRYEAELTFTNYWDSTTGERQGEYDPDESVVRDLTRIFVHNFYDKPEWFNPYLKKTEKLGLGHWRVEVIEPYCD
jgi:hypothetical protein